MGMTATTKEVRLRRRPTTMPGLEDFDVVEVAVGDPGPGEVLVRSHYLSVGPYMRGRMNDGPSYVAPFALGAVMTGAALGEIVASRSSELSPGHVVVHDLGWREMALGEARRFSRIEPGELPWS